MPRPIPSEILLIEQSEVENHVVQELTCADLMAFIEGYFRLNKRRSVTEHNSYVNSKCLEMYDVIKELSPGDVIIRISYLLDKGLQVGVYIEEKTGSVISCIKGYRAGAMTPEEHEILWFGAEGRS